MNLDSGDCFDVCGSRDVGMRSAWLKHHSDRRNRRVAVDTDVPVITSLDERPGLRGTG